MLATCVVAPGAGGTVGAFAGVQDSPGQCQAATRNGAQECAPPYDTSQDTPLVGETAESEPPPPSPAIVARPEPRQETRPEPSETAEAPEALETPEAKVKAETPPEIAVEAEGEAPKSAPDGVSDEAGVGVKVGPRSCGDALLGPLLGLVPRCDPLSRAVKPILCLPVVSILLGCHHPHPTPTPEPPAPTPTPTPTPTETTPQPPTPTPTPTSTPTPTPPRTSEPPPETPAPTPPSPPESPAPTPPRPPRPVPPPPPVAVSPVAVVPAPPTRSPSPPPTPTPPPALSPSPPSAVLGMRHQRIQDRFAERRQGTDRRLVILVLFTGVISVTAVALLKRRPRR
ncbi:hypothetical protein [Streptosporangium saharense]